jgi:hypothetical protein
VRFVLRELEALQKLSMVERSTPVESLVGELRLASRHFSRTGRMLVGQAAAGSVTSRPSICSEGSGYAE